MGNEKSGCLIEVQATQRGLFHRGVVNVGYVIICYDCGKTWIVRPNSGRLDLPVDLAEWGWGRTPDEYQHLVCPVCLAGHLAHYPR